MMRFLGALLCFGFFSGPAIAEALVRSGNHPDFARLVVYLPPGQSWQISEIDDGAVFEVEGWSAGFNARNVFSLIPRNRLTNLTDTPNTLRLEFNCSCDVRTEALPNGPVIIDLIDVPAVQDPEPVPVKPIVASVVLPLGQDEGSNQIAQFMLPDPPTVEQSETNLDEVRSKIVRELGRAASSDLIEFDRSALDADHIPHGAVEESEELAIDPSGQVRASNSAVYDTPKYPKDVSPEALVCLPNSLVAIESWGTPKEFSVKLAHFRSTLFAEFDVMSDEVALDIARLYVANGLAEEALAMLGMVSKPTSSIDLVREISLIIKDGSVESGSLRRLGHCSAEFRLWEILSGNASGLSEDSIKEAVQVFSGWPDHLRRLFGPPLENALSSSPHLISAAIVQKQIVQLGAQKLTEVEDDLQRDDLLDIINNNTSEAPLALDRLLAKDIANDRPIDAELILLGEAFAFELGDTDLSLALRRRVVLAKIENQDFIAAIHDIGDASEDTVLVSQLMDEVADNGSAFDVAYLGTVLKTWPELSTDQYPSLRRFLSKASQMGQSELVKGLVSRYPDIRASDRVLANIAIAERDTRVANSLSRSEELDDATRMRLLWFVKQNNDALSFFENPDQQSQAAWRTQAFDQYVGEGIRTESIQALKVPIIRSAETPISNANAILALSTSSRNTLEELLR